ncbi:hypothetical protein A2Z22_03150 [Candidatus Woesebacteria bacterium RBG_16_34_12]|uniref:Probable pectate lyase C n=1 Tax=Candidatus Woesebacteria bacterium RBG_16_34_12 TaxID=1802480 RepID=A0A1F7XAK9_9BACT|nr:MAG: hypothetical protein A2Z22_03150 [Candidatus Woesebacteria bacterium RBG_16_34_12]
MSFKMRKIIIFFIILILGIIFTPQVDAATYYMALNGNDANPGTEGSPWLTLSASINKLQPGDILNIREGTYYEGGISTTTQGTTQSPIVIQSYPGERAVIDGGVADYKSIPNNEWELVDTNIGLYRSTKTYTGTIGAWLLNDNWQLIQYSKSENMDSTYYGPLNQQDYLYFGPGIQLRTDNKLYIRLQSNPQDLFDADGNPISAVPLDTNPNNNSISVFTTQTLLTLQGASYLEFKDITFQYARRLVNLINNTNNITFDNCIFNYGTYGFLRDDTASYLTVKNSEFNNGIPRTLYWTDVKNGEPDEAIAGNEPYPEFQSNALDIPRDSFIENNYFHNGYDGTNIKVLTAGTGDNIKIFNNYFTFFGDDAINLSIDASNVEITNNLFWNNNAGISLSEHEIAPGGIAGDVFIHHNVVDGVHLKRLGRPGNYREGQYPPWVGGHPFGGHSGQSAAHWKIYNNTLVAQKPRQSTGNMGAKAVVGNSDKYFYNNILYALDNQSLLGDDQESLGSHYDGDIFWQKIAGTMFYNFANSGNYISLVTLRTSGSLWEANGLQLDPGFNEQELLNPTFDKLTIWNRYLPTNNQVFTQGVAYTGLNWPGIEDVNYRGAVPSQSTQPTSSPTPILIPGDANSDGKVDGIDYVIWLNHYNSQTSNGQSDGDFNTDGDVDGIDYVIWLNNYGT